MSRTIYTIALIPVAAMLMLAGCGDRVKAEAAKEAPPAPQVEHIGETGGIRVDHPEQFPIVSAVSYSAAPELDVTGLVAADVSRAVPVISLAAGRVVGIHARLGDTVTKGQPLMRIQSADISSAFSEYRQTVADLTLARAQLERSRLLLEKGAIAQKDYEIAVAAEAKARVNVETTQEHLRVLGADQNHPTALIDVVAPISGVITDQQVTAAAGVQGLASPNPFTISDLSQVWVLCDVYENDLRNVRVGEFASIRLNAYPDQVLSGRIANIGPILDAATRTAKVRLELRNPGMMRVGMFVTATFRGSDRTVHATVPASAILHLHDREWVYAPAENGLFLRAEVVAGKMLPDNMQEVTSGLKPGDRVVANALAFQNTAEQ
jgi:membrane fusion protein, heavy metal efflux system